MSTDSNGSPITDPAGDPLNGEQFVWMGLTRNFVYSAGTQARVRSRILAEKGFPACNRARRASVIRESAALKLINAIADRAFYTADFTPDDLCLLAELWRSFVSECLVGAHLTETGTLVQDGPR